MTYMYIERTKRFTFKNDIRIKIKKIPLSYPLGQL